MMFRLFKDVTPAAVHKPTALGNEKPPRKPKPGVEAKPKVDTDADVDIDVDKAFAKATVVKLDETLGLVFGFAIVCKKDGEDYYDLQGDHIPEDAMLKATREFMIDSRVAKEMHTGDQRGSIVFAFPLTTEIAKALEIETKQTGFLVAMWPDEAMWKRFKSGELTGFSIGGRRVTDEEVA